MLCCACIHTHTQNWLVLPQAHLPSPSRPHYCHVYVWQMTGAIAAAGPTARVRTEHETRPGEKQDSPVNLASRSGVLDKLSVTAEMSTTKRSDAGSEVKSGGRKQREGTSVNENVRRKGRLDLCACVRPQGCYCVWMGQWRKGALSNKTS